MFEQTRPRSLAVISCLAGLALYSIFGGYYASELVVEIAVLAIIAISLDLVAGFGGMHSLFHSALAGLGAYGFAIGTQKLGWNPFLAIFLGVILATAYGAFVGYVSSRTSGIFFIMATLAFGQMAYNVGFHTRWLGGDDGMTGVPVMSFSWLGIDLNRPVPIAIFSLAVVGLVYFIASRVLISSFGRSLVGMHVNEDRMTAIGVDTRRVKTIAFALSSLLASIAGLVATQHSKFVSPEQLSWTHSGEVLVIVILGGIGTLVGPLIGAIVFVLLKHQISNYTNHWPIVIGLMLIFVVMVGGRGVWGEIESRFFKRATSHA